MRIFKNNGAWKKQTSEKPSYLTPKSVFHLQNRVSGGKRRWWLKRTESLCLKGPLARSLDNATFLPPRQTLQTTWVIRNDCGGPRMGVWWAWSTLYSEGIVGVPWQEGEGGCWRALKPVCGTVTAAWLTSAFAKCLAFPSELPSSPLSGGLGPQCAPSGCLAEPPWVMCLTDYLPPTRLASTCPGPRRPALALANSRHGFRHVWNFSRLALMAEESRKRCWGPSLSDSIIKWSGASCFISKIHANLSSCSKICLFSHKML